MNTHGFQRERQTMVERQLHAQGIRDPRVLEAMERVPRHFFLPQELWHDAYAPRAVQIGHRQTISQPYMVAIMTQTLELRGEESVLEIGTGSGYQAAILAWLGCHVVTIERIEALARDARARLEGLGLGDVEVVVGDGSSPSFLDARFDRILVTAAAPSVPVALLTHLADPGLLVCPVGDAQVQSLHVVRRENQRDTREVHTACRFVPLIGREGFFPE